MINRKLRKIRAGGFCEVDIKVENGRLSVSGTCGRVRTVAAAKEEALDYWEHYFEDNPAEEMLMSRKFGKRFKSSRHAAEFVVKSDGDFHGLDVVATVGKKVLLGDGFGQITDEIRKWFPKVAPLLPWHLNDMHAGCEHQRKLKWGPGKVIALAPDGLTEAQELSIREELAAPRGKKVQEEMTAFLNKMGSRAARVAWVNKHNKSVACSNDDLALFDQFLSVLLGDKPRLRGRQVAWFDAVLSAALRKVPEEKFKGALYQDCLGAPCPECGYKYGTAWVKEELPLKIVQLAASVYKDREVGCEPG